MKRFLYLFWAVPILIASCDLFDHMQHMDPPEIKDVTPSDSIVDAASLESVALKFSEKMDRVSTEGAFVLSENDEELDGSFSWSGKTMSFTPYHGFKENREYMITLKDSSEDKWGNSLEQDYYKVFKTGEDVTPPYLVSTDPVDYSVLGDKREPLTLIFSEALDQMSFRSSYSLTPDINMDLSWNAAGNRVTLNPLEDYQDGENYELTLPTDISDLADNPLETEEVLLFRVSELAEPVLTSLTVAATGAALETEASGPNTGLEKDMEILGVLDRSLHYEERSALISFLPSVSYDLSWNADFDSFTLGFNDHLEYGRYYEMTIGDGTYILLIDGAESVPLSVSGTVFCPDSTAGVPVMTALTLNSSMAAVDSVNAFLDLYLSHAAGAVIDIASFMDAFSLKSSVLSFENRAMEIYDGSQSPAPSPLPGADETVVRISLGITDTNLPGTVTISLDDSVTDSYGNSLTESWNLTVSQP